MSWQIQCYHGVELYQALSLNKPGLSQGFSMQSSGNLALHTGDVPEQVIERRRSFLKALGLELEQLVAANQVHSTTVRKVDRRLVGAGALSSVTALPETDALITQEPGIVLAIFTADCLPIFLYDPDTPAIAIIHAGWRGTLGRIVEKTLEMMVQEYQTVPGRVRAAIGPAICRQCFQVKPDLADKFAKEDPLAVQSDSAACYVDLPGFNARLLAKAGVAPENIDLSGVCTGCQREMFFSYRAGNQTIGRMMGIISMKN